MLLLLLTLTGSNICFANTEHRTEEEFLKELKLYSSLENLLSYFGNETKCSASKAKQSTLKPKTETEAGPGVSSNLIIKNPLAHQILDTFHKDCQFTGSKAAVHRESLIKPVIVIEGNHKSSRDVIVMGLSELMNARYITHPSPCLHRLHKLLPKGSLLRRCYYLLSNYAGSIYAKSQLNKPIIINGYWTEQMAFTLTHFYPPGKLPPITSDIYNFPHDLLQPDIIFYLNFPDNLIYKHVTTKSPLTWKPRMLEVFKHMQSRLHIVIMDVKPFFKLTTEDIHRYILQHLYHKVFGVRNSTGSAVKSSY